MMFSERLVVRCHELRPANIHLQEFSSTIARRCRSSFECLLGWGWLESFQRLACGQEIESRQSRASRSNSRDLQGGVTLPRHVPSQARPLARNLPKINLC